MTSSRTLLVRSSKLARPVSVCLAIILLAAPLCAQRPGQKPAPARAPQRLREIAIESLLADDSYKVVGEVRNIGQLLSTGGGASEIIEPIMKLADPPQEFKELVKFLNANTETLTTSRLMFAAWPARPNIPNAFVAIELPSANEAEKFEPKLNRLLPLILPTPTPTPSPEPEASPEPGPAQTPAPSMANIPPVRNGVTPVVQAEQSATLTAPVVMPPSPAASPGDRRRVQDLQQAPPPPLAGPPFVVSRLGNLVFVTDKAFKFENLRPAGSRLLSEDQNFRLAHDRFATDPVFIYVDVALEDKARPKPSPMAELSAEEIARMKGEEKDEDDDNQKKDLTATNEATPSIPDPGESPQPPPEMMPVLVEEESPEPVPTPNPSQQIQAAAYSQLGTLFSLLTNGEPEWPDAVGIAVSQETDSYVVHAILLGPQNAKRLTLPFVPQLIAGRGFTPNAPSVLPDDTEILISASLDFTKTYEAMLLQAKKLIIQETAAGRVRESERSEGDDKNSGDGDDKKPDEPFAEFETKGGFKIKDDFLPAFGNEVALAGSLTSLQGFDPIGIAPRPSRAPSPSPEPGKTDEAALAKKQKEEQSMPVFLLSVRDREAARRLMPRILDGLGVGEANLVARPERREDTELVDFAGVFAYAFVGDFVVISTTATVRHVIDSFLKHETLSSNNSFRNFTHWEPREALGQIYISPALMETYQKSAHDPSVTMPAAMREFLMRLSPAPQAITYAMSNEGFGALHELHLPKTFVIAMVAGSASATKETPPELNESVAISGLQMIVQAEKDYQAGPGKGSYGSLEVLVKQGGFPREMLDKYGYRFDVTASSDHFEANAVPNEYGKTGRRSFFVDQSGIVRGDDHLGGPATAADKRAQ